MLGRPTPAHDTGSSANRERNQKYEILAEWLRRDLIDDGDSPKHACRKAVGDDSSGKHDARNA